MSSLMSVRSPIATWTWLLDHDVDADGLDVGAPIALTVADTLEKAGLLVLDHVDVEWHSGATGPIWPRTRIRNPFRETPEAFSSDIRKSRPSGHPDAIPSHLHLRGRGYWATPSDTLREEPDICSATLTVYDSATLLTVGVHHDIWSLSDFLGRPHPDVHERNAPRLEKALRDLETALSTPLDADEPDEPTKYAEPVGYGVSLTIQAEDAGENP
ncbi:hypothetical protein [Streptomonospora nanhaiensis]|uniref:Uncharacterized protein n=1 Tax=Streptomonospora nanhaiensis TaxID=1323731 RepID=A0A853BQI6_9ACTN|nr:hypothetical protein [Streptomonospora nanhaiensis]MBV2362285.1 hypothetical protein [Streptomonospora nanhaiensis]NYI97270.1 hypothetical protein [Streptomonospora nanhaiensis]